jgi:Galactose oxidase, central domain
VQESKTEKNGKSTECKAILLGLIAASVTSVLVAGGAASELVARFASAEIFDPETGKWTPTGDMTSPRSEAEHAAVLLRDGRVLVPGGYIAHETGTSSADLYDPETGTWAPARLYEQPPHRSCWLSPAWQSRRAGDGRAGAWSPSIPGYK